MPRPRKTPVQQEKIVKEEINRNTVTLTRTRRTPKPNPRYSSADVFAPIPIKQPASIKSRSNSPEIKEEKHIPVLRKRGITPDSVDYSKLAPKKRLIERASTPKTEPTRKLPERVAKNVQSVQKPTNTQNVVTPAVKQKPTMVKMTRSSIIKKLDDDFNDEEDNNILDKNKTDDAVEDTPTAVVNTRSTRDSTRKTMNSLKTSTKIQPPISQTKVEHEILSTSEEDNTELDYDDDDDDHVDDGDDDDDEDDDMDDDDIDYEENDDIGLQNKNKNGVKNCITKNKNYGKKNDLNKAIENEATIVETISKNNVPTFTIVNINDIINKKSNSNDDSMDSVDLTASPNDNSQINVNQTTTRGGRRKTVHKVLTDNVITNSNTNINNKSKQQLNYQQPRILNKTLGSAVVASSAIGKGGKTLNQINKPRILNAMLAKGLADHKAATTTLKIVQTSPEKPQQQSTNNNLLNPANGLKVYQQQQQQQQKTQNQLIRRDYHPKVQASTNSNNNLTKQLSSSTSSNAKNNNNLNNINIVKTYGRLNDKYVLNKQPSFTNNNNNSSKILNNNSNTINKKLLNLNRSNNNNNTNKLIETSTISDPTRKITSAVVAIKPVANIQNKNAITGKGITTSTNNNNNNNNKLIKRLRKITCFETWYVINIPKYTIKLNNTLLMFSLVNLGNNIKEIKLPTTEWSYKIILENDENTNNNKNNLNINNNLTINNNNNENNKNLNEITTNNNNNVVDDKNEVYSGDLYINDTTIDNNNKTNNNYKPFIIQFHRFIKEKTKNINNNEDVESGSIVVPNGDNNKIATMAEEGDTKIVDADVTLKENNEKVKDVEEVEKETKIVSDDKTETNIKLNEKNDTNNKKEIIELYDNNKIKQFNINNYYKNNIKTYDRILIFKNNQYFLIIDGNLCKLIGQPQYINNINDIEILLNIINDINIINSYIYIENNNNNTNNINIINDTDDTDNEDDDFDGL